MDGCELRVVACRPESGGARQRWAVKLAGELENEFMSRNCNTERLGRELGSLRTRLWGSGGIWGCSGDAAAHGGGGRRARWLSSNSSYRAPNLDEIKAKPKLMRRETYLGLRKKENSVT
jgi:hypothetical protein